MNYKDSVNYIHSLLKFGIRPGLNGMDALFRLLGNPHSDLKCIHVAGTNGKGSVSTAMSNILIDSGLCVGLYTSPYVSHFLERVQINGRPVSEEIFAQSVEKVRNAVEILENQGTVITEFEALTASAFLCFKAAGCDACVLEVGLGGRLDATNVIPTPLCNVITSLSLDHIAILGNTVEEIAFEKCGTIKSGGRVVCSMGQSEGALNVIKNTCRDKNNRLIIPDESDVNIINSDLFGTEFIYKNQSYKIPMAGLHQTKNMTVAIECAQVLKDFFSISEENIKNGISKTVLPARVEVFSHNPLVILDGGHNKDGAKAFYNTVEKHLSNYKNITVIAGMMGDKEVESSLKPLLSKVTRFVAVTPENPRAMSAEELAKIGGKYCKNTVAVNDPKTAVRKALASFNEGDALLVVGSLYLAGEVRDVLTEKFNKNSLI